MWCSGEDLKADGSSRSSTMSSMAWAAKFMFQDTPAYKISKAALNALTVQYSLYHKEEGFIISACNPGVSASQEKKLPLLQVC
jgi:NAD(P)-dependent dehydrogenase (short-subunit alcohol dehydrogenase family)